MQTRASSFSQHKRSGANVEGQNPQLHRLTLGHHVSPSCVSEFHCSHQQPCLGERGLAELSTELELQISNPYTQTLGLVLSHIHSEISGNEGLLQCHHGGMLVLHVSFKLYFHGFYFLFFPMCAFPMWQKESGRFHCFITTVVAIAIKCQSHLISYCLHLHLVTCCHHWWLEWW